MKEKILFIVNPISGHKNKKNFPSLVESLIDKEKYDYSISWTEYGGHAKELAREAIASGVDVIVAVGGDGTINEIGTAMLGAEQTFAIVPCGSGNGLARHLHIPLKAEKVINEVINKGVKSKIDTASINGVPFISIGGVGFDAIIADYFAKDPNRGLKTYVKLVTERYFKFQPEKYHLILDDDTEIDCEPLFISFANSNQFGNNAVVSPHASLNDGLLDVCVFKKPSFISIPDVAVKLMTSRIDHSKIVDIYKAKKIKVIRQKEDIANVDGEAMMMAKDLDIEIKPLSLNILLPDIKQ
jgi:lipid kinase, YegS/Rv2252/BmrU family